MYTVQPQTVVILVLLGDVSPRKYLDLCWDFKMSQIKLSSKVIRRVIPSLSSPTHILWLDPQNPAVSLPCERGLETSIEKQLCILSFCEKESFWLYVHDLRRNWPRVWRGEFIQLQPLLDLCLGMATFCLVSWKNTRVFCCQVNSNGININNSSLAFCPFSWTTPQAVPVFGAKIDGHSPKHNLCSHITIFPPQSER